MSFDQLVDKMRALSPEQLEFVEALAGQLTLLGQNQEPWFAVRSIFRHDNLSSRPGRTVYEERIVLFLANDAEEALQKAEIEARDYCGAPSHLVRLDFCESFHLFETHVGNGTEVFSLMRELACGDDEFIQRYFDDEGVCRTD